MSDEKKPPKLLGSAEIHSGVMYARMSRTADPERRRIPLDETIKTVEQGKLAAHLMTVAVLTEKLERAKPRASGSKTDTVADWCDLWHADRLRRQSVVSDLDDRSRLKVHVLPLIGDERMSSVSREQIAHIVAVLDAKIVANEISWKTASTVWGVVKKMFSDARASKTPGIQVRDDDPTDRVQAPERGEEKSKAFLYPSEFLTLVTSPVLMHGEGLPKHIAANVANASRRWFRLFALASYLGVRAGELRSLRWTDIDLEHMVVHVHVATEAHSGGKREKKTKTGVTRRFAIEPSLCPLLEQLKRETGGVGHVVKVPSESDLSARLKQYLRWAGVDREELFIDDLTRCSITFKDLRATYLTWRAIRGDDPLKIQRAAGHKTLNTTQIYIRAAEDLGGSAGEPFPPLPAFVIGADEAPRRRHKGTSTSSPTTP